MKINPTALQNAMVYNGLTRYQTAQKSGVPEGRIKQIIMTKHCSQSEKWGLELALGVTLDVEEENTLWKL